MVMLKIIEVYCDTAVIFGFLNLDLFSYPNNMIQLVQGYRPIYHSSKYQTSLSGISENTCLF